MSRYLIEASYTTEGLKGVLADGATSRVAAVEQLVAGAGGSLVSLDFAFGDTDVYGICELPDDEAAASVALAVGASGAMSSFKTVKLLTPEQLEAAGARTPDYTPPGS